MPHIHISSFQPFASRQGVDTVLALRFRFDRELVDTLKATLKAAKNSANLRAPRTLVAGWRLMAAGFVSDRRGRSFENAWLRSAVPSPSASRMKTAPRTTAPKTIATSRGTILRLRWTGARYSGHGSHS
jgi:hypothetical protein